MTSTEKPVVAAFDFDGTITSKDTFIDFARFSLSPVRFWVGLVLFSPLLVMVVLKLISGGWVKERLFSHWFVGWTLAEYRAAAQAYCDSKFEALVRPKARNCIEAHRNAGDEVFLVSASTKELLMPFAKRLGLWKENVLGTTVATENGRLTGAFASANCKGAEKVRRLLSVKPRRDAYRLVAYGDSAGDKELLAFADQGFYREFE